jgi:1-aminocyclopropane-1-carboxylate deaminase/D-cysteine desulfhydrase-like pyridoxal-dependent ACC family enzyme
VLGYVSAFHEMVTQSESEPDGEGFDYIVFASSSGGTQAGLVLGALHHSCQTKLLGISVDEQAPHLTNRISDLIEDTAELLGTDLPENFRDAIHVIDRYIGDGYGIVGKEEKNAIQIFAEMEGILLDPVYTGRAAAGMLDLIQTGEIKNKSDRRLRILFWHTGGTPALFASKYAKLFTN